MDYRSVNFGAWVLNFFKKYAETITEIIVIFLAFSFLLWPVKVDGEIFEKSLANGDWVFSCKAILWFKEPNTGDVVMYEDGGKTAIKRVVAGSGDEVLIEDKVLYVNGERISGDYLKDLLTDDYSTTVAEGHFLAFGDGLLASSSNTSLAIVSNRKAESLILFKFSPANEMDFYL